jgi:hypothetical protein
MVTGMTDAEPDKRLEVVLAESLRALAHQQSLLDNLRSRATLLTTAAALVSTFPGLSAITGNNAKGKGAAVLAVLALVGVLVCTLVICAPWWRWYFRSSATALLGAVDAGHDLDSIRRNLSRDFEKWVDHNDRRIRTLQWWFTAGLALLFVEVVGWIAEVTAAWGSA